MNRGSTFLARASLLNTIDLRVLVLALGTFAIGTDAFIIGGILPEIAQDLSVSIGKTGLVVSVFSLSYALGSPIVWALTRVARRIRVAGQDPTVASPGRTQLMEIRKRESAGLCAARRRSDTFAVKSGSLSVGARRG
jgi:MFS family permease